MRFPATPTLLLAAGAVLAPVHAVLAQCPDGTPPPCARPGVLTRLESRR